VIDSHAQVRAVVGDTCTRSTTAERRCSLVRNPSTGAQFFPRVIATPVDSRPPAYRNFDLHPDGRIDTAVHWIGRCRCARPSDPLDPNRTALMRRTLFSRPGLALAVCCSASPCARRRAAPLWNCHGKHNTVICLARFTCCAPSDYPLSPAVLEAYRDAKSLLMEVIWERDQFGGGAGENARQRGPARRQTAAPGILAARAMDAPMCGARGRS